MGCVSSSSSKFSVSLGGRFPYFVPEQGQASPIILLALIGADLLGASLQPKGLLSARSLYLNR
jgi:hypothetical protein